MFVDPDKVSAGGDTAKVLAAIEGTREYPGGVKRHACGLFEIGHFNFNYCLGEDEWDPYSASDALEAIYRAEGMNAAIVELAEAVFIDYGVCDSIEQFLDTECGRALLDSPEEYCVSFTHVAKEPGVGGWRWHKWGPYIGLGEPTTEYLADEEQFAAGVYCFHVYRRRATARNPERLPAAPVRG